MSKFKQDQRQAVSPTVGHRCFNCDSTDLIVKRKINEMDCNGIGPDGKLFTSIIRRQVRCRSCGQVMAIKDYRFDPTK